MEGLYNTEQEAVVNHQLDTLPSIITSHGDYVTRAGNRVTIHTVDTQGRSYWAAKGSRWLMFRGKVRPRGYDIWHVSGRSSVFRETPRDIVGPWQGEG